MVNLLDACSAVAFLRDEPGADVIEAALQRTGAASYIHAVNLAELYYVVARDEGDDAAEDAVRTLTVDAGVSVCLDMDEGFCKEVGRLRAFVKHEGWRIALADCFCLAAARRLGGQVLTTDAREFDRLIVLNWCPIQIITRSA